MQLSFSRLPTLLMAISSSLILLSGCSDSTSSSNEETESGRWKYCNVSEKNYVYSFLTETRHDTLFVCDPYTGTWKDANTMAEWAVDIGCDAGPREFVVSDSLVFVCSKGVWRPKTDLELDLDLVCNEENEGSTSEKYLQSWPFQEYFMCMDGNWEEIDGLIYRAGFCTKEFEGGISYEWVDTYDSSGRSTREQNFVCEGEKWRLADEMELFLEESCSEAKQGLRATHNVLSRRLFSPGEEDRCEADDYYICDKGKWRMAKNSEQSIKKNEIECYKPCYAQRNEGYYVCIPEETFDGDEYYNWINAPTQDLAYDILKRGACNSEREGERAGNNYQCLNGKFVELDSLENRLGGKCTQKRQNEIRNVSVGFDPLHPGSLNMDVEYFICVDTNWRVATDLEILEKQNSCATHLGQFFSYDRHSGKGLTDASYVPNPIDYICDSTGWRLADESEKITQMLCHEPNEFLVIQGHLCENGTWRKQTKVEAECGICNDSRYTDICRPGRAEDSAYVCESNSWRLATELENDLGLCGGDRVDLAMYHINEGCFYICKSGTWTRISDFQDAIGEKCGWEDETQYFDQVEVMCKDGVWKITTPDP